MNHLHRLRELARAGETLTAIARQLGVSKTTVRRWCSAVGITLARAPRVYRPPAPKLPIELTCQQCRRSFAAASQRKFCCDACRYLASTQRTQAKASDPTPQEIALAAAQIRATWTDGEWENRAKGAKRQAWSVPDCSVEQAAAAVKEARRAI